MYGHCNMWAIVYVVIVLCGYVMYRYVCVLDCNCEGNVYVGNVLVWLYW
jgi:hypothetical protein